MAIRDRRSPRKRSQARRVACMPRAAQSSQPAVFAPNLRGGTMVDTRRRLLLGACVAATGAATGAWLWRRTGTNGPHPAHGHDPAATATHADAAGTPPASTPFEQPLRLPGVDGLMADVRLAGAMTLRAATAAFPIFAGAATTLWHYAGEVAGRGVANPVL